MALPTPVKTWEFLTNKPAGGIDENSSWRQTAVRLKNHLTNTVAHIYNRGEIELVSGTTFRINPGDGTFDPATIGNVVGRNMKLRGMTTANNDGDFTITAQSDQGGGVFALEYVNVPGAAETIIAAKASVNVIGNDFTIPLILQHSASAPDSSTPVAGDEIDRLEDDNLAMSVPNAFDVSYWVVRNTVTGTEFCVVSGNTSVAPSDGSRGTSLLTTAPNSLSAPAASQTVREAGVPVGPTVQHIINTKVASYRPVTQNDEFLMQDNVTWDARIHVAISDDGEQVRALIAREAIVEMFMFDAIVRNPKVAWAADPSTPVVAGMRWPGNGSFSRATYGEWNDATQARLSRLPSPSPGIPPLHVGGAFLSSEGYGSAALGQNLAMPNELTGEWPLLPVGIAASTVQFRGRMGLIPDMWWASVGNIPGQTFPNSNARNFLCIEDFIIVWNGDIPEMV
jgi:hypothetical protein